MAIASSLHTTSANTKTMSSNAFLVSKNELTISDGQFIEILLHGQNSEQKSQAVIRWCKNPRHNRLSSILDVSQRYEVVLSLINTLQQTNNTEFQYHCLTLLAELHSQICHYDQRIYLPGIIQCFSSTSTDVQSLAFQLLEKQIRLSPDIATFLFLYTEEGLKSINLRQRIHSIQSLVDLLSRQHQYENLSPVLEVLLESFQDPTFHSSNHSLLHQSIQHIQHIIGPDLFKTYMDTYPSSIKRVYYSSVPSNETDPYIPTVDTDIEDEEETPRASVQVSQLRDSKEKVFIHPPVEDLQPMPYSFRKSSLSSQSTPLIPPLSNENTEFNSIIDLMRSKWLSADEPIRLEYLDRFKHACDKYFQILRNQHLSNAHEIQYHQVSHRFFGSILDLLNYLTSSNLELSIKIKLVLSTCLGWLIKQSQVTYCKKNYKTICHVFKNILLHGHSNNRQLAKLSVSLILLLENFVPPQLILNELIDENFQYQNFRIQLEMLAIVTATLIKYRQKPYENLAKISKEILPMLVSNRRELRHGALECFTMICSYFNNYKPISLTVLDTNSSIKLLFTLIENVSIDASNALRFRLQRNLLPSLTDEGNITPGLVCDGTTMNDPDAKFILIVTNPSLTPQPVTSNDFPPPLPPSHSRTSTTNSKLSHLTIPSIGSTKTNAPDAVLRTRDIPPLKSNDMDLDLHRVNVHHRQQHHLQTAHFNRRLILPNKRQMPIATAVTSTAPAFDFALTGNRPLTLTEKVYPDEWNKKSSQTNHLSKEPVINQQKSENHHNNTLQFRPLIPRRSSVTRFAVPQQFLITTKTPSEYEVKTHLIPTKRPSESEFDQDEGIDSAIESRSLSITTSEESDPNSTKKPVRSVHSSSTRRKAERLFSNGSDFETGSARTLTPENSNESGVYSQSGRDNDYESHDGEKSTNSFNRDQLFSTRPRLARSGSKSKLDRSQLPPTDPSSSSRGNLPNNRQESRPSVSSTNSNVEIIGKGYTEEKHSPKSNTTEIMDDKMTIHSKPRSKIIRGSVVAVPLNTTTHTNVHHDDVLNLEDAQDIGVVGKAVHLPQRTRLDSDRSVGANPNKVPKRHDSFDIVSDEFDSDSKENENFAEMGQSLSASFRLRVQQKTQEKIEQKERRRQDREIRRRQLNIQQPMTSNSDLSYDTDIPVSSTSTSRYSSQPDLVSIGNDLPPATPRRPHESNGTSILPNVPSQQRLRAFKNPMARSQTFNNRRELTSNEQRIGFTRPLSEDRITDQLRNPEAAYREAIESVGSDDWERKCSGLGLLQRLIAQYSDLITQNLHQVVLVLIQEVKNLRSQVARFALGTFCDMFIHLKRNMDIELDLTVKAVMQKSAESNEFLRSDAEKCLQSMIENVTLQKALQALIAGGASHRNPAIRKTSAKYIYLVCEKLGATKILNGTRDITERVLQVAATFASDGPPEIRWYGKKIYHMLMPFDELDSVMKHYLNPTVYTNMCDILDNIRAKGGVGETPSESARNNVRRTGSSEKLGSTGSLTHQFSSIRKLNHVDQNEQIRDLTRQMRSSDFRERLNGIEEFQKLCELETEAATNSLVQIFDAFNECLADTNSKVLLKALNTMHQLIPILADALSSTINSTLPIVAQSIASKNREISQVASDIIDAAIEYIDCGCLLQPLCTLSQNSNLRVRPEIVLKLATLVPRVCQRKPKQVEIHLLPTYWKLLALLRGQNSTAITSSAGGANSLNTSIHVLTTALYAQYGSILIDRASSSSSVTPKNLQILRDLCANIDTV